MKKKILIFALILMYQIPATAKTHHVVQGDSMWKIAVKYEVGLSELKQNNPHIHDYTLIYPGDIINIPEIDINVLNFEREVVNLVNEIRLKNGLTPMTSHWELSRIARYKSRDMSENGYFSHTSPVYGSPFDMIKSFGLSYKTAGENIAKGQKNPKNVVAAWMNSTGHRANILNSKFTTIGVGYEQYGHYWTQMFMS